MPALLVDTRGAEARSGGIRRPGAREIGQWRGV